VYIINKHGPSLQADRRLWRSSEGSSNHGLDDLCLANVALKRSTAMSIPPIPVVSKVVCTQSISARHCCQLIGANGPRILYTTSGGASWASGTTVIRVWTGWLWSTGYSGVGMTLFGGTKPRPSARFVP
jgi:hypothetical protein